CGWIGKASMLRPGASYLDDPTRYQRTTAADHDHSWTAQGVDPDEKIAEIARDDPAVARVLRLQHAFGLRIQEASLLNPARDIVNATQLRVVAGTKGGRPRVVPIETDAQRAVLAEAQDYAQQTRRSMIPSKYDLKQWLAHCYHVLTRHGVTRKDGLVSHGLRHQYANDQYEAATGEPSPVRGGGPVDPATQRQAQRDVASRLGHARPGITAAYYGKLDPTGGPVTPALRTAPTEKNRHAELRVQQQLLAARLHDPIGQRANGAGAVSTHTLRQRWTVLHRLLALWADAGVPLSTSDALSEAHIAVLHRHWSSRPDQNAATVRNQAQLLAQLCGWLARPDLIPLARAAGQPTTAGENAPRPPLPLSEDAIAERIARIRAEDLVVAVQIELVRVIGLTHRQAARLQPAASYRDGVLDVFWETPKNQVLRFAVTGERAQAVLNAALALRPEPDQAVCPVEQSLSSWLRHVYHLLRTVGRIGVPGEPTLAALKDPAAPTPVVLPRESWLLERAGLTVPGQRS
ncbi:MAG: integrase domain-containing protein, partial [Candidatus Competibacteraceae bacterium]|nr:integrase domain-containing protein [Candidatus Competibacteraceae bacterium]